MVHETRIIPLDARPPLGKELRFDVGSARGHWEGDTLVVETTNFKQRSAYRNANADTLRLVERFRRTAPDRVEWSVTVEDPSTWAKPWTFAMPLTRNDEEAVELYECHEGNHAIFNILSAARAAERESEPSATVPVASASRATIARTCPSISTILQEACEVTFIGFVLSLAHTAAFHFGDVPDPVTGQAGQTNLAAAHQIIEILALLEQKTRGNLTAEERQLMEQIVYELQMRFVEATKTAPQEPSRIIIP